MKRFKNILAAAALGSLAVSQSAVAQVGTPAQTPAQTPGETTPGTTAGQTQQTGMFADGTPGWLLAATALAGGLFIWAVVDDDEDGLPEAPVSP